MLFTYYNQQNSSMGIGQQGNLNQFVRVKENAASIWEGAIFLLLLEVKLLNKYDCVVLCNYSLSSLKLLHKPMSSFIPSQVIISQAFAIAGLVLVAPSTYFFRNYSRVLDYVQLFYVFALTYAVTSSDFSLKLGWGFLTFIPSFLTSYCTAGDYLCTNGYLISAGISWFGAALLMLIIIKIVSCKKAGARYQPFYNFWKGLLRWFMGPLVYYSTLQIISSLQSNKIMDINFIAAAGVCALLVIWMFVELIGYKCVQREEENNWKKWCDFFSHFRMISVVAIAVISLKVNSLAQYFIYGPILIYDIVFLVKYKFTFRVLERIFFILEEAALITVFSLFLFGNQYIYNYNLDLIGIAIAIVLDVIIFIPKLISYCKSDEDEVDPEVNPEKEMRSSPRKRGNSIEPNLAAENSYDNLRNESPSPRRNNAAGKRR